MAPNCPEGANTPKPSAPLLKSLEAAQRLAISPRKLWALTASGEIPSVRIGRNVRYATHDLDEYVAANTRGGRS